MGHVLQKTSQLPLSERVVSEAVAHLIAKKPSMKKETQIVEQLTQLQLTVIRELIWVVPRAKR